MSQTSPLQVALFGAGRIGKIHAQTIYDHAGSQLKYVVDLFPAAANELAHKFGAMVGEEDKVLNDPAVDVVLIASATPTHASLIEKAMAAGKAVFCEKPIDLSLKRVDQLLENIKSNPAKLFLGFNRRFDPAIMEMVRRIEHGSVGDIELVTIISKDPSPPPVEYINQSGGMFRDMTIHDFDMASFLIQEPFVEITAMASCLVDPAIGKAGDIDTACVTLKTQSGKIAVITNSRRASFGYDQRIEVHGAKGQLRTENIPTLNLIEDNANGVMHEKPLHFFLERYAQSYRNEWHCFVEVLKGKPATSRLNRAPDGKEGRLALMLADAAYQSLESKATVKL